MNGGNGKYPRWFENIEEELKEPVYRMVGACRKVGYLEKKYRETQSDGDKSDLEGAKQDLNSILLEVHDTGTGNDNNPLWNAIMHIRPRIIGKRMNPFFNQYLLTELWKIRDEAKEAGAEEKGNFFGKLGGQLIDVPLTRGFISGDVVVQHEGNGKKTYHYPPGIPPAIRQKVGVKNTTRRDNWPKVQKAYEMMRDQTTGAARKAMEGHLEDLNEILRQKEERYNRTKRD